MKKLLCIFLSSITPAIIGMEINLVQPQLTVKALSCFIENIHRCQLLLNYRESTQPIKKALKDLSQLNKYLYKEIHKIKKQPIFISNIIRSLTLQTGYEESHVAHDLTHWNRCNPDKTVPCDYISLTRQLYDESLTREKVKELYHQGALINYREICGTQDYPIIYWIKQCINKNQNAPEIIETLLELGAENTYRHYRERDTEGYHSLLKIYKNNPKAMEVLFKYKPKKIQLDVLNKIWRNAFGDKEFFKLLLKNLNQKELTEGLRFCAQESYNPEIMQQFLDHGANPDIKYWNHQITEYLYEPKYRNRDFHKQAINNFNFLCDHGAYNKNVLANLEDLATYFTTHLDRMKKNKPSDVSSTNTEQK